jgi:hypothetical protein
MSRPLALAPALAVALALASGRAGAADEAAATIAKPRRLAPILLPDRLAAPAGAHLTWSGGRILSNVEIVLVQWGDGAYAPYVTGEDRPTLSAFFAAIAGSAYVTGLAEYDTARGTPGRAGQHVGAGTFAGMLRITPGTTADAIEDAAISRELAAQLDRGGLPPPRADAEGRLETLYVVAFPAGKRITFGAEESCRSFCAYHGSFPWRGATVPYAVLPDLTPGSGCDLGCGRSTPFANAATVASHELAEAITDPDVAGGGAAVGWYDPVRGEIADLCAGEDGTAIGTDGERWPVQRLWSNARGACVVPLATLPPLVASSSPALPALPPPPAPAPAAPALALSPRPIPAMALSRLPPAGPAMAPGPVGGPGPFPAEPAPPIGEGRALRVELVEDNDAFGMSRPVTDEFYSQGFRLEVRWAAMPGRGVDDEGDQLGIAFGQNIYTPSNLQTTDLAVLRLDRPYAGWLYLSALLRTVSRSRVAARFGVDAAAGAETVTEAELTVGVTGRWSLASDLQHDVHSYLDQRSGMLHTGNDPAGWPVYQLDTLPTLDFSFRHERDVFQASASAGDLTPWTGAVLGLRVAPRVRFDVGSTYDAASLGLEARGGLVQTAGPARRAALPLRLYAYGRVDGRYVFWNEFIEGPLLNGVVSEIRLLPWVMQYEAGVVLRLGHLELAAAQIWSTREFSPAPPGTPPLHDVGRFTAAWVSR